MGYVIESVTRTQTVRERTNATCDNCGKTIPISVQTKEAVQALEVGLFGGYESFYDIDDAVRVLFCEACATQLVKLFPCLKEAVEASWQG